MHASPAVLPEGKMQSSRNIMRTQKAASPALFLPHFQPSVEGSEWRTGEKLEMLLLQILLENFGECSSSLWRGNEEQERRVLYTLKSSTFFPVPLILWWALQMRKQSCFIDTLKESKVSSYTKDYPLSLFFLNFNNIFYLTQYVKLH